MAPALIETDEKELEKMGRGAVGEATTFVVSSAEQYKRAGELRNRCVERAAQAEEFMRPRIQEAFQHHRALVADLKSLKDPFDNAGKIYKQKMIVWDQQQERIRAQQQARLEKEARERAEREAAALAATMKEAGAEEAAEEVIANPIVETVVAPPKATPKVEGFTYRSAWSAEVKDLKMLVLAVAAGIIEDNPELGWQTIAESDKRKAIRAPIEVLSPEMTFLNQQARAYKSKLNILGVEAVEKKV